LATPTPLANRPPGDTALYTLCLQYELRVMPDAAVQLA
jgi:hypothetical protein